MLPISMASAHTVQLMEALSTFPQYSLVVVLFPIVCNVVPEDGEELSVSAHQQLPTTAKIQIILLIQKLREVRLLKVPLR